MFRLRRRSSQRASPTIAINTSPPTTGPAIQALLDLALEIGTLAGSRVEVVVAFDVLDDVTDAELVEVKVEPVVVEESVVLAKADATVGLSW